MRKLFTFFILFLIAFGSVIPAKAEVFAEETPALPILIEDQFEVNGTTRTAGDPLVGTLTESGQLLWDGSTTLVFAGSGEAGYVTAANNANQLAAVPFSPEPGGVAVIEADVKPAGSDWVAIGFSKGTDGYWTDGQFWIRILPSGHYSVMAKTNVELLSGEAPSFDPNGYTRLKLQYNAAEQTVSAWINGINVADEHDWSEITGFTPDIRFAGFMISSATANQQAIGHLIVRGTAAVEPELPVTISDSLSTQDGARAVGSRLVGQQTEIGGREWEGSTTLVFGENGGDSFVTTSNNANQLAGVPYIPAGEKTIIEADVRPAGSDWTAVGFSKGTDGYWADGQLWILLQPNGHYAIKVKTSHQLAAGEAPLYDSDGFTKLKIQYNTVAKEVSVWVNGVEVLHQYDASGIEGFVPKIEYAGFMMASATANTQAVKNFRVLGIAGTEPPEYPDEVITYPDDLVKPEESDFPVGVFEEANLYNGNRQLFKETISELYSLGFDSVMLSNGNAVRDRKMFDVTDRYGFNVYYNAGHNISEWMNIPDEPATPEIAGNIARAIIDQVKDHPSVKSINLSDEPTLRTLEKHVLLTEAFHQQAPNLKITTPLIGLDNVGSMFTSANLDALLVDIYPMAWSNSIGNFSNLNSIGYSTWDFVGYLREISKQKPDDKPLWVILQAFQYEAAGKSRFSLRVPTPAEVRAQNWLSIGEGATGIFWFLYNSLESLLGLKDIPAVRDEAVDLASRVKPLRPVLLAAKKDKDRFTATTPATPATAANSKPYVSTLVSKDGTKTFVVAVNMDCVESQNLTIHSAYAEGHLKDLETGLLYDIGTSPIPFEAGDGRLFEVIPTQVNEGPAVEMISPIHASVLDAANLGSGITLEASATSAASIGQVEFYANGKKIGTAASAPYRFQWLGAKAGSYSITAVAKDVLGAETTSQPVDLMVKGTDNVLANPSFETADGNGKAAHWSYPAGVELDSNVSHTGASSLRISGPLVEGVISQDVSGLEPNTEYELSGWVKTSGIQGAGIYIRYQQKLPFTIYNEAEHAYGTSDWTRIAIKFTTPAFAQSGSVDIHAYISFAGGSAWLDDFSLVPTGKKELSEGLQMHLTFDEANGLKAKDFSGNGRDGDFVKIVGGEPSANMMRTPVYLAGKIGSNTLYMEGGNEYLKVGPGFELDGGNGFTVSTWIKPYDALERHTLYADDGGLSIEIENSKLKVSMPSKTSGQEIVTGGTLSSDRWYHTAVTFDETGGMKMFIDGVQVGSLANMKYVAGTVGNHYIGQSPNSPETTFWGYIDDVRIYSRVLPASELMRLVQQLGAAEPNQEEEHPSGGGHNGESPVTSPGGSTTALVPDDSGQKGNGGEPPTKPDQAAVISFKDIQGHWASELIKEAVVQGLADGFPDGTFGPELQVTRAQFMVLMARAMKSWVPEASASRSVVFADLEQIPEWAREEVALAVNTGLVEGYDDATFRPYQPISRAEMAIIVARALQLNLDSQVPSSFKDAVNFPQWAKGGITEVERVGIMQGKNGNRFAPFDPATRAEAVVVMLRMMKTMKAQVSGSGAN
ncbi:S-layer homology domain-containing protein [Paenibacillus eucommiae]|uniref:SLH domain-containing protein n=2 Tax=Paenibacillus eucommiae TaxID=1355755 RepID=A0ABS4ISH4_9BACL|nr:S-layer homology domain-containing protein [Paenibacillus eucommiae]MBP1990518.1 hypothetical protein [Paenibacillus eucommiae]